MKAAPFLAVILLLVATPELSDASFFRRLLVDLLNKIGSEPEDESNNPDEFVPFITKDKDLGIELYENSEISDVNDAIKRVKYLQATKEPGSFWDQLRKFRERNLGSIFDQPIKTEIDLNKHLPGDLFDRKK